MKNTKNWLRIDHKFATADDFKDFTVDEILRVINELFFPIKPSLNNYTCQSRYEYEYREFHKDLVVMLESLKNACFKEYGKNSFAWEQAVKNITDIDNGNYIDLVNNFKAILNS